MFFVCFNTSFLSKSYLECHKLTQMRLIAIAKVFTFIFIYLKCTLKKLLDLITLRTNTWYHKCRILLSTIEWLGLTLTYHNGRQIELAVLTFSDFNCMETISRVCHEKNWSHWCFLIPSWKLFIKPLRHSFSQFSARLIIWEYLMEQHEISLIYFSI